MSPTLLSHAGCVMILDNCLIQGKSACLSADRIIEVLCLLQALASEAIVDGSDWIL